MKTLSQLKNNKGFILILTYLLIVTLAILGTAFFSRSTSERKITNVDKDNILAANIAEAGINRVIAYMRVNQPSADLDAPFDPFNGTQTLCTEPNLSNCAASNTSGTYSAIIDPADDNHLHPTSSRFTIRVTGTVGQISRTVSTVIQMDNFARFAYFSDNEHYGTGWWRQPVWFISGDTITGPTHTNGHFHISGSPVFNDVAASVDDYITLYHPDSNPPIDNPQFLGGLTLGTEPINMPSQAIALHNASVQGGMVLNGDSTVVLTSDGKMSIQNNQYSTQHGNCNPCTGVALPTNHALYVAGGNLTLSGTLNGSLTVGTNRNIIINNNVKYSKVPLDSTFCPADAVSDVTLANDGSGRLCSSSASTLGIVAEKQVIVSSTAPYNVEIDASIMSMDKSFTVENWDQDADSNPSNGTQHKGILKVFGGIIQNQRGPVGSFTEDANGNPSIATGYTKNYIYDSRFSANPPYYFPQTGDYLKLLWQENLGFDYYNVSVPEVNVQ